MFDVSYLIIIAHSTEDAAQDSSLEHTKYLLVPLAAHADRHFSLRLSDLARNRDCRLM